MKLIDLLDVCDIDLSLFIYDEEGDLIAIYDGKDSIDTSYNDREVFSVTTSSHPRAIEIYIEEE